MASGCCPAGVHHVFDTSFSRNFSLLESQREFVRRFRAQNLPVLTSVCPGVPQLHREFGGGLCALKATSVPQMGSARLETWR